MEKSKNSIKNFFSSLKKQDTPQYKIYAAIIAIILVIFLVYISKKIFKKYKDYKNSKLWILKGTKSARQRTIILQDPSLTDSKTIKRSKNEEAGIEFTYMFWVFINDWSYKYGQWKHIMHKGNESSWPLRAPGVWLHPKQNTMRVYMNTFTEIGQHVDIPNIPLNKWFFVAISIKNSNLDVYINSNLVKRKELNGIPKQNFSDLYLSAFDGFGGYLSNIRYFDYYASYAELFRHMNRGPSMMPCIDSKEMPPYLTANWWTDNI